MGYGDFLNWSFTGQFELFNRHLRWPSWEAEVASLALDQGIGVYPLPFTTEGHDLSSVSRRPVPIGELLTLWESLEAQIADLPDGAQIVLPIDTHEP